MKSALDVCQRFEYDAQIYDEYSQAITKFSQAIWTLITTEVEDGSSLFSPICQILDNISNCNMSICKEIVRAIEDLRDIYERSVVIQRKTAEHALLIKLYEDSKLKVSEAKNYLKTYESKPDFYIKKDSLENSIKELEREQKEATRKARDGTLSLIEAKKKYQSFAMRRTKSCFERIGNAFKDNSEQSIILLSRFIQGLQAIKNGNPLSNFVLYGQDTVPDEINNIAKMNSGNQNNPVIDNDNRNKHEENNKESSNENQEQYQNNPSQESIPTENNSEIPDSTDNVNNIKNDNEHNQNDNNDITISNSIENNTSNDLNIEENQN